MTFFLIENRAVIWMCMKIM